MKSFLTFILYLPLLALSQEAWAANVDCERQFMGLKQIFSRDKAGQVVPVVSPQARQTAAGVYLDEFLRSSATSDPRQLEMIEMAHRLGAEEALKTGVYRSSDKLLKEDVLIEAGLIPRVRKNILNIITLSGGDSYRPFVLIETLFFRHLVGEALIPSLTVEARNSIQGIRLEQYLKRMFHEKRLTEDQLKAVEKAHKVGSQEAYEARKYSSADRDEKNKILTSAGFSDSEVQKIIDIITQV